MENTSLFYLFLVVFMNGANCYDIIDESNSQDDKNITSSFDAVSYSVFPDFPLLKCYCGKNHVWENGTCTPTNTTIEIFHKDGPMQAVATSDFNEVVVGELECDNSSITPETISNVILTDDKTLLHLESKKTFAHFCVEHTKNDNGNVVLEARVCPDKETLFKCYCGADHVWKDEKCHSTKTSVDFIQWDPFQKWKEPTSNYNDIVVGKPKCENLSTTLQTISHAFLRGNTTLVHLLTGKEFTQYCVENVKNSTGDVVIEAQVCLPHYRVPSCCPSYQFFNHSSYTCYSDNNMHAEFDPPFFTGSNPEITLYHHAIPNCSRINYFGRNILDNKEFYLDHRELYGIMFVFASDSHPFMKSPSRYCVAMEQHNGTLLYSAIFWDDFVATSCDSIAHKCDEVMNWLLLPLLLVSTLSLLIILVLHAIMPEMRKSVGSKNMICHVVSLFFGFCLLLLRYIDSLPFSCKVRGPMVQMCFLASIFWLNVMCFDLWCRVRSRNSPGDLGQASRNRFMWYSIYAWGCPLLIGIVTIVMDNIPSLESTPGVVVPGFDKLYQCWFADEQAAFLYYFLIIAVLMAANIIFFLWVFFVMIKANCTYQKVLKQNKKSSKRTWIYLKVFSVMGITWIYEYISWEEGTCQYWAITDIINALRGLVLGLIFFGNKQTLNKIGKRFSTMNQSLHDQLNRSVNNLRNLTSKPSPTGTSDLSLDSRRTSDSNSELHNRVNSDDTESRCSRGRSSSLSVVVER